MSRRKGDRMMYLMWAVMGVAVLANSYTMYMTLTTLTGYRDAAISFMRSADEFGRKAAFCDKIFPGLDQQGFPGFPAPMEEEQREWRTQ